MESSGEAIQTEDNSRTKPALAPKPRVTPKPFSLQQNASFRSISAPRKSPMPPKWTGKVETNDVPKPFSTPPLNPPSSTSKTTTNQPSQSTQLIKDILHSNAGKPDLISHTTQPKEVLKPESIQKDDVAHANHKVKTKNSENKIDIKENNPPATSNREETGNDGSSTSPSKHEWGGARNRLSAMLKSKFESGGPPPLPQPTLSSSTIHTKYEAKNPNPTPSKKESDEEDTKEEYTGGNSIKRRISLLFDSSSRPEIAVKKEDPEVIHSTGDVRARIKNWTTEKSFQPATAPTEGKSVTTAANSSSTQSVESNVPSTAQPAEIQTEAPKEVPEEQSITPQVKLRKRSPALHNTDNEDSTPMKSTMRSPKRTNGKRRSVRFGTVERDDGGPPLILGSASESSAEEENNDAQEEEPKQDVHVSSPAYKKVGIFQRKEDELQRQEKDSLNHHEFEMRRRAEEHDQARLNLEEELRQKEEREQQKAREREELRLREEEKERVMLKEEKERQRNEEWKAERLREEEREKMLLREEEVEREKQTELMLQRQRKEERERAQQDVDRLRKSQEERKRERLQEQEQQKERLREARERQKQIEHQEKFIQDQEEHQKEKLKEGEINSEREREAEWESAWVEKTESLRRHEGKREIESELMRRQNEQDRESVRQAEENLRQAEKEKERLREEAEERERRRRLEEEERMRQRLRREEEEVRRRKELERKLQQEQEQKMERLRREEEEVRKRQELERKLQQEQEQKMERLRREEEEVRRGKELERKLQKEQEQKIERQKREEEIERKQRELQIERKIREEELERKQRELEIERMKREEELERKQRELEMERQKKEEELERKQRELEMERRKREEEMDRKQRELEMERMKREEDMDKIKQIDKQREVEQRHQIEEEMAKEQERVWQYKEDMRKKEEIKYMLQREEEKRRKDIWTSNRKAESLAEQATQDLTSLEAENEAQRSKSPHEGISRPPVSPPIDVAYDDFSVRKPVLEVEFDDFSVKPRLRGIQPKVETAAVAQSWVSDLIENEEPKQQVHLDIIPHVRADNHELKPSQENPEEEEESVDEEEESVDEEEQPNQIQLDLLEDQEEKEKEDTLDRKKSQVEEEDKHEVEINSHHINDKETEDTLVDNAQDPQEGVFEKPQESESESPKHIPDDVPEGLSEEPQATELQKEPEFPPFPESTTPLLDTSTLKSKVDLGRRRSRARPTRSFRIGLDQTERRDWRVHDSLDENSTSVKQSESDSEDEQPKPKAAHSPPSSQKVPAFPGVSPAALIAQLKRRVPTGGTGRGEETEEDKSIEEKENQDEEVAPSPLQLSRSPRSASRLAGAALVLPPLGSKDGGAVASPAWLKELKSKKRLSQHDSVV